MKSTIKGISIAILVYLVGVLLNWDFNTSTWDSIGAFFIGIAMVISIAAGGIAVDDDCDDNKSRGDGNGW